jgi:hypothetical protein
MAKGRRWSPFGTPEEPAPTVHATGGSVAAGHGITNSTIQIGLDEAEIEKRIAQAQRPLIEQLSKLANRVALHCAQSFVS